MMTDRFETLVRAVVDASVSKTWSVAVSEWCVVELEEDTCGQGVCVCGKTELVKLFTIENELNGSVLYPIGSVCVNKFGRQELDQQVNVYSDLLTLRNGIRDGERITLTAGWFSRAVLEWLFAEGAFTPNQWNGFDAERDVDFLLEMFNKRNKDAITRPQEAKIHVLLTRHVAPFVRDLEILK